MTRFDANKFIMLTSVLIGMSICGMLSGCRGSGANGKPAASSASQESSPPALAQQGKLIFDNTPRYAGKYVGNKLSCNDCHLQSGTADFSAPMIDMAGLFPMYNKRAGHVISLQNRIQECFTRSEAGTPPPQDSGEMRALVAYIDWLSRDGVKGKAYKGRGLVGLPALQGDPVAGKAVYISQCAACHGADGAGVPPVLPALWGSDSYNDGAGMNNPAKMAGFVMHNMPQNHPGTLTPQQAYDVAAYVHTKVRPRFNKAYKGL
jgi:thiosulfate dehydrogenase